MDQGKCRNCGQLIQGKYCSSCGEKILEKRDFSMPSLLSEAIGSITNLDSKIISSLRNLFFRPGQMSRDIIDGKRVRYVKPFQLFLIANILYFILLPDMDLFRAPARWHFFQGKVSEIRDTKLNEKKEKQQITLPEAMLKYDNHSSNLAKSLLILIIPLMSIYGWLVSIKLSYSIGQIFIYSLHTFTFLLLLIPMVGYSLVVLGVMQSQTTFLIPILSLSLLYITISYKKFFQASWVRSIISSSIFLCLTFFTFFAYRSFISQLALETL